MKPTQSKRLQPEEQLKHFAHDPPGWKVIALFVALLPRMLWPGVLLGVAVYAPTMLPAVLQHLRWWS